MMAEKQSLEGKESVEVEGQDTKRSRGRPTKSKLSKIVQEKGSMDKFITYERGNREIVGEEKIVFEKDVVTNFEDGKEEPESTDVSKEGQSKETAEGKREGTAESNDAVAPSEGEQTTQREKTSTVGVQKGKQGVGAGKYKETNEERKLRLLTKRVLLLEKKADRVDEMEKTVERLSREIEQLKLAGQRLMSMVCDERTEQNEQIEEIRLELQELENRRERGERGQAHAEADWSEEDIEEQNIHNDGCIEQLAIEAQPIEQGEPDRQYLESFPEALSVNEWEWEQKERRKRKKNIMIYGVRTVGKRLTEDIKNLIKEKLGLNSTFIRMSAIGGGLLGQLEKFSNKIEIMKKKKHLSGTKIRIEDDLTPREKEVQDWLEQLAQSEERNGLQTQVGYMKVKVDGSWYSWNECQGTLEKMELRKQPFRGTSRRKED